MKANSLDRNEDGPAKGLFVEEVDLFIEELEDVIAPGVDLGNHNETMASDDEIDLQVEELEDVIAPRLSANHNETMVSDSK